MQFKEHLMGTEIPLRYCSNDLGRMLKFTEINGLMIFFRILLTIHPNKYLSTYISLSTINIYNQGKTFGSFCTLTTWSFPSIQPAFLVDLSKLMTSQMSSNASTVVSRGLPPFLSLFFGYLPLFASAKGSLDLINS